ncbi:hypothetical protein QTJ16_002638 [Diplocarpon rosae]|uniref:FAD-binding domain-containing protein n=1 Tax=Diplocarpon rosae TaxID=946125 RepID=A0AAD9WDU3_9HELO|nr:hypothetical protein QTJ16_002638 [Diplocarpon rosae]PBP23246.1 oxidoreductase [Diplocarpon rosae]
MSKPSVLISGAGIAGPVCAHFLARAGIKTTIVERSPSLRRAGQQIDIRGAGLTVVQHMNLEATIRSKTTKEAGLAFVDSRGRPFATFPVDEKGGRSFTSDVEIVRGELAQIVYDASKETTEYVFGDHVTRWVEREEKIEVEFASGGKGEFDMLLGADGMGSKIRRLAFPDEQALRPLGQYTSFFTVPYEESDGRYAQWYNAPGGRCILLRPDHEGNTRVYLSIMSPSPAGYYTLSIDEQKQMMHGFFADAGWEAARVLRGMDRADDFYMQEIAQIKMRRWSQGRVGLLGDAGYCPSPISGMGTSLALIGAYVLAGEIARCGMDHHEAFRRYQQRMHPYVEKAQRLLPGAPALLNPQTRWGIAAMKGILGLASWSRVATVVGKLSRPPAEDQSLPVYDFVPT